MEFDYYQELSILNGTSWDRYFRSYADETINYDVIVIGSGMGGGILGDATSDGTISGRGLESGLRTLVLEAGPIRHLVNVTDLPLPNVAESCQPYELVAGTTLRGGLSFNLGGRSIFWSAVIPPMREWELRHWPKEIRNYLIDQGGYDEADKLFRKRAKYPRFQKKLRRAFRKKFASRYEVDFLPRSLHQPGSNYNPLPGWPDARSTGVFSTAALLANSLNYPGEAGSKNLHVAVQHVAHRLIVENDTNTVRGVEVLDLRSRARRTFYGRRIVLACGTIESARLALASGLRTSEDNAQQESSDKERTIQDNWIGRGLTDHPKAELQVEIPQDRGLGGVTFTQNDQGNIFLRPHEPLINGDSFSCELAMNWKFWDVRIEDDEIYQERFQRGQPTRSTIKFLFRNELCEENQLSIRGARCFIKLKDMTEPVPMASAKQLAGDVLEYLGLDRAQADKLTIERGSETPHLAGSMRMGDDSNKSVVDTNLKVHKYEHLYCCDLSVFPDVPASNPSLTLGALALRLAKHLKTELAAERAAEASSA